MKGIIYIDEEYGYRHWKWNTGKTDAEMIEWWTNLKSVDPFFFSPKTLPFGKVKQVSWNEYKAAPVSMHLHTDDDSFLWIKGTKYRHAGYKPLR